MRPLLTIGLAVFCLLPLRSVAISAETASTLTVDERVDRIDKFLHDRPWFLKERPLREFRGLAPIQGERTEIEANPHMAGETIEYRHMLFAGLRVVGVVQRTGDFMPVLVTVSSSKWKMRNALNIGTRADAIAALLGPPMSKTATIWEYHGTSDQVKFHIRRNVIEKIELQYYFD